jgi:hypothetical protein
MSVFSLVASLSVCAFAGPAHAQLSDSASARSRDGHIAFIRSTPGRRVATSLGDEEATELCITNSDGTKARLLVTGTAGDSVERAIAGMSNPRFSLDGKTVYFQSRAWVTSDAVHAVDVASGREWFVAPGNILDVIPRGPFAGCLLVGEHRYNPDKGGSYDGVWLFNSRGKEIALAAKESAGEEQRLAVWMSGKIPAAAFRGPRSKASRARCS